MTSNKAQESVSVEDSSETHGYKEKTRNRINKALAPYLWILPSLLVLAIFLFYPISFNFILSFFDWNGFTRNPFEKFVLLSNYLDAWKDPIFVTALKNTLIFVLFSISVTNIIALLAAVFLFQGKFRGKAIIRAVIFFPGVLSAVVVSLIWKNIVLLRDGLIHQLTTLLGLPEFFPLGNPDLALYVIIIAITWQWVGFNFVIFYAGLQSLDQDLLDAARVDGAGFWQLVFQIIIPQQYGVVLTNVILNLISGFQVFDIVYVMTRGGPIHSTEVLASYMISKSFSQGQSRMGYAAAIASMMMIMTLFFSAFRSRLSRLLD